MKKSVFLITAALVLAGCSSPSGGGSSTPSAAPTPEATAEAAGGVFTPGTYTGTAMGFHNNVTVEVEVDENSIVDVRVTETEETRYIADNAIEQLPKDMVAAQSVMVDSYTGCTVSSGAVKMAARNALQQAADDISAFTQRPAAPEVKSEELTAEVVVLGGGMGGLASAITAAENGASVILLEKLDRLGGSTVESGGIYYATGSPVNKELDDDVQAMVDYWQMRAEGNADEKMLTIAASRSGESVAKLQEWGVMFADTVGTSGTSDALRAHYASNPEAAGAATDGVDFIAPLDKKARDMGVDIRLGTRATELLTEDGVVAGVLAESDDTKYAIHAGSVIIATGGYDLSKEMMAEHSPDLAGTFALSSAGNTGDGILMAEKVGAATNYTSGVIGFKMIDMTKHYLEGPNMLCWMGPLGVTSSGVRFGNENADYPIFCTMLVEARRNGDKTFFIVDSTAEAYSGLAELAVASSLGFKADTLEDLAAAAGINAEALADTVEKYNAVAATGEPDEYGKTGSLPVTTAPFYAVEVKPATLGTIGGLLISENAEVLDTDGNPIPNLYACGEVANSQLLYKEYPASGSSISMTSTFGRIAGAAAAQNAGGSKD